MVIRERIGQVLDLGSSVHSNTYVVQRTYNVQRALYVRSTLYYAVVNAYFQETFAEIRGSTQVLQRTPTYYTLYYAVLRRMCSVLLRKLVYDIFNLQVIRR